jgi:hypothetical protein
MCSRFALCGLLGAAIACGGSPTAPSPVLSSFQVSGGTSFGSPPAPPSVQVSPGRVAITAETNTPTPCYTLAGDFTAASRELRLHVDARPSEVGGCVLVLGRFSYNAVIMLPAGNYTLVVVHAFPGTGWPATEVLRQTVTVN